MLTFDVDFWIRDDAANLARVTKALHALDAKWGKTEASWAPVPEDHAWLLAQNVFCLTSPHGAIDIFRSVAGLDGEYEACKARSSARQTPLGVPFRSLDDPDMLVWQLALPEDLRRQDRTQFFKNRLDHRLDPSLHDEKAREEAKRERMYDPILRWKHIQETITWAEANMPEHLRRNRPRVHRSMLAQS